MMQTASLMKATKVFGGNPFRDGLTSPRNLSHRPARKISYGDTDERNPSMEEPRSHGGSGQRLSFAPSPMLMSEVTEVDSEDESCRPLHLKSSGVSDIFRGKKSLAMNPRLTLSAFRRPENTIRLTKSDPSRSLTREYSLQEPSCGVLGHGAFSTVRLGVRRIDSLKVAVKTIAKHEALRSRRLRIRGRTYLEEWEILRRMKHNPYIVNLLDVFETDDEIQLVLEYCEGGELFDAIQQKKRSRSHSLRRGQYTESQASTITKQLLHALADLHAQGLVHRDVKAENILLASRSDSKSIHVKLCDFGVARVLRETSSESGGDGDASPLTPGRTRSFSMVGSDYYMAPEMCFGGTYDTAVDIYSLGVTLYILLCGFPPVFAGEDSDEVIFPSSYWKDISDDAKDLVRKMLAPDVSERISAQECLQHGWIVQPCSGNKRKRASDGTTTTRTPPRKRRFERRASATLMALADLYRGVTSSTPSVAAIAASSLTSSPKSSKECKKSSFTGTTTVAALSF